MSQASLVRGANFILHFLLHNPANNCMSILSYNIQLSAGSILNLNPSMRKKVVLIEDDPDIRELIEFILTEENYEVTSFDCTRDFRKGMREQRPDLILLDIMLPDGNGIDLCGELKADENTRSIPVVLMSANYDQIPGNCAAEGFIAKPFDINDLVSRVRRQVA